MTKSQYISYIKNLLPKIDQTNKYHPNVIAMAVTAAQEQLFNELYRKGELLEMSQYTSIHSVAKSSAETGWQQLLFSDIGANPISLERKSGGVDRIVNEEQSSTIIYDFKPTTHQEYYRMDTDVHAYYNDVIWYIVEPSRILVEDKTLLQFVTNFYVYMIPKFYDHSSTQEFNFPRGHGRLMTQYTLEALGVIRPKDLVSDNTDTQ